MLRDFLTTNRPALIERCRNKVLMRRAPRPTPAELEHGVPLFLDQLIEMLPSGDGQAGANGWPQDRGTLAEAQIKDGATRHGSELLRHDFTIEQVVHDYGDLCQSITELAIERQVPISVQEFSILNIRLDNAISGAVTEYARQHERVKADAGALATNERLGLLAHEMRNLLNTTILAISAIKRGSVGFGGATAAALDRSLISMRGLIDRTLAEVRLEDGSTSSKEIVEIGPLIADVQVALALEASTRGCELAVQPVEPGIFVAADRHILASAVANVLQNAFTFTRADSTVLLRANASNDRVFIEVADECGGLAQGMVERLFRPFEPHTADHRGVGLGLSLSRKAVEAIGGTLSGRTIPDVGCVFVIDLPQKRWVAQAIEQSGR
jgi:signal transduction histidine kinase